MSYYYEPIRVKVTTVAFEYTGALSAFYLNAKSSIKPIEAKGRFANTLRAFGSIQKPTAKAVVINSLFIDGGGFIGAIKTSAFVKPYIALSAVGSIGGVATASFVELRTYNAKNFGYLPEDVLVGPGIFEFATNKFLMITGPGRIGPITTKGLLGFPTIIRGVSSISPIVSKADVYVPFAIRHRGAISAIQTSGDVFIPPFELKAKSSIGPIYSTGFVAIPYLIDATLQAKRPTVAGTFGIRLTINSQIVGNRPRTVGEIYSNVEIEADAVAPSAYAEGDVRWYKAVRGTLTGKHPQIAGTINVELDDATIEGVLTAKRPGIVGEVHAQYSVNGVLEGKRPGIAGEFTQGQNVVADLVAKRPTVAGELTIAQVIFGDITAPRAIVEASLKTDFDITGVMTAKRAKVVGELNATQLIEGVLTAKRPGVVGDLKQRALVEGVFMARRAFVRGALNNIIAKSRRTLTIIE